MIRQCNEAGFAAICEVINDAAEAYHRVIPADRWQVFENGIYTQLAYGTLE